MNDREATQREMAELSEMENDPDQGPTIISDGVQTVRQDEGTDGEGTDREMFGTGRNDEVVESMDDMETEMMTGLDD